MLSYGYFVKSESARYRIGMAQKFPWFGTLRTRGSQAAADASVLLEQAYAERNRLYRDVKQRYYEYAFLRDQIVTITGQEELVEYIEDVVLSKYAVGMAPEDALLRVQTTREKLRDRREQLEGLRVALSNRLAESIGRAAGDPIPWPTQLDLPVAPPELDQVIGMTRAANPDLQALDYRIQSRSEAVELAEKKGYPDFTFGLEYQSLGSPTTHNPDRAYPSALYAANRIGNGIFGGATLDPAMTLIDFYSLATNNQSMNYPDDLEDNFAVSFSMNIPLWRSKVWAGVTEAHLRQRAAEHDKAKTELTLQSALSRAVYTVDDERRRYALYEESLLPKANRTYESVQSSYSTGSGASFIDLMDSTRTLLDFQLEQVRAAHNARQAAADLEYLIGAPWQNQ